MCLMLCASLDAAVSARTIPGDPNESLLFYSQRFLLYNVTSCKSLTELHHRIPISCIYGSLYMVKIVFYSHFICLINPYESLRLTQMMDDNFYRNGRYFYSGTKSPTQYFLWDSVFSTHVSWRSEWAIWQAGFDRHAPVGLWEIKWINLFKLYLAKKQSQCEGHKNERGDLFSNRLFSNYLQNCS